MLQIVLKTVVIFLLTTLRSHGIIPTSADKLTRRWKMQIGSKFTIGVHIITAIDYFKEMDRVNSEFLAGSIGVNPVIVRSVISQLREAGSFPTNQPVQKCHFPSTFTHERPAASQRLSSSPKPTGALGLGSFPRFRPQLQTQSAYSRQPPEHIWGASAG